MNAGGGSIRDGDDIRGGRDTRDGRTSGEGPDHLDDGALVRVLDGEASEAEAAHVRECVPCRARFAQLEGRSDAFGRLVDEADGSPTPSYDADFLDAIGVAAPDAANAPRRRRPARVSLRWAAVLALLAVAAAAPPVRAFVARAAVAVWSMVAAGPTDQPAPAPETPVSAVETTVAGPVLTVVVPPGTTVRLVPTKAPAAAARLRAGGPTADVLVRSDGFEVTGAAAGAALEVAVPPGVERVRVEAVGRTPVVVDAPRDSAVTVRGSDG